MEQSSADQVFFTRGRGDVVHTRLTERVLPKFLFCVVYSVLILFYKGVLWFISRNTILLQGSRGSNIFQGIQFLQEGVGVLLLIPMETYRACDFQGGPDKAFSFVPFSRPTLWIMIIVRP